MNCWLAELRDGGPTRVVVVLSEKLVETGAPTPVKSKMPEPPMPSLVTWMVAVRRVLVMMQSRFWPSVTSMLAKEVAFCADWPLLQLMSVM